MAEYKIITKLALGDPISYMSMGGLREGRIYRIQASFDSDGTAFYSYRAWFTGSDGKPYDHAMTDRERNEQ